VPDSEYVGDVVLLQGGIELLRLPVGIDHPRQSDWTGEQADTFEGPPKQFIPEPHSLSVMLLDAGRRGEIAEAMVAVIHGRVHMVGVTPFRLDSAQAS
jgi:hypothetical protein